MSASQPEEPTPAQRWFSLAEQDMAAEKVLKAGLFSFAVSVPRIHGLNQLLDRYSVQGAPDVDRDDLDLLDPWVIDGRYAADLPDLGFGEANDLLAAAHRVVEAVVAVCPAVRSS